MISLTLQPSRTTLVLVWYQFMIYLITANLISVPATVVGLLMKLTNLHIDSLKRLCSWDMVLEFPLPEELVKM